MAATTIFFNGRLISIPGSYSEVDASGLEALGLGASGIVACVGMAIGGIPYTEIGESDVKGQLQVASNPRQPFDFFRSGDLKEAGPILFGPSVDDDIVAGAQEIVYVKVNPATQSTATFNNTDGAALVLTSADYGFFTTQIKATIGTGTNQGKLITVTFEDVVEAIDDAGGDEMFKLVYLSGTPADGFTTITAEVTASALVAAFTRDQTGLDGDVTNQVTATQVIECVSSSASDDGVIIEIYGTNTSDQTQRATVTLTGVTPIDTTETWNEFHGVRVVTGTLVGTLTLQNDGGGTVITTIAPAGTDSALEPLVDCPVAGSALSYVAGGASTDYVTVVGLNRSGAVQTETVQLNGTTPVPGTATWSQIDYLALGAQAAATTLTVSGNALNVVIGPEDARTTLQQTADYINSRSGFTFTLVTGRTSFLLKDMDVVAATSILSPTEVTFYANLYLIVEKINAESSLVVASEGTPGTGAPDNTTVDVFLSGGHEGNDTAGQESTPYAEADDWQAALDLLTKVRVNSVIVMTHDTGVHDKLKSHLQWMSGAGRSERDSCVGIQNAGDTGLAAKAEIKTQIIALNNRNIRAWAQNIERYNTSGSKEVMAPKYGAAMIIGAQAGCPVGTSMTHKFMNTLSLEQDSSWNPTDDAEEMIQAGLCFGEVVDGIGRRVVRNVTTHLTSSNIAYTEASVNEAVNYSVYTFRTAMETQVGEAGFAGTVSAASALAVNQLGLLVGVSLLAWRSLTISLTLDVLECAVEMAPVLPINFVKTTVHLVSIPQSAAAA